jgi:hypothetical protein
MPVYTLCKAAIKQYRSPTNQLTLVLKKAETGYRRQDLTVNAAFTAPIIIVRRLGTMGFSYHTLKT